MASFMSRKPYTCNSDRLLLSSPLNSYRTRNGSIWQHGDVARDRSISDVSFVEPGITAVLFSKARQIRGRSRSFRHGAEDGNMEAGPCQKQ